MNKIIFIEIRISEPEIIIELLGREISCLRRLFPGHIQTDLFGYGEKNPVIDENILMLSMQRKINIMDRLRMHMLISNFVVIQRKVFHDPTHLIW